MALANDEGGSVGKESARNDVWVKISIRKVHTFLKMKDNDKRKYFIDYLCVDLNFVEEQRNNLMIKHKDIGQELNTCKEKLLELKHAKLDFLTIQHENTEILIENQTLRKELKELTKITETWINSSNKVNQCITEQIPNQKRQILGADQLTKDSSNYGQKDLVFVKFSSQDNNVFKLNVERPWLSEAEGFNLPNQDTGRILYAKSQVNVIDSSVTNYDSADESTLVCSTSFPPFEKLVGAEPETGPKTIKSILKSCSTRKDEASKDDIIKEANNSSAHTKGNKTILASKKNSTPIGKLNNVKTEDDILMSVVMKELNDLKLQISKNQSSYNRNNKLQQVPQTSLQTKYKTQFKKACELYGMNNHL
ncbi:hypothetical protein Tco_1010765 [Tanacetum coccineum]